MSGGQDGAEEEVAILMGCRDGARFLPEQLASIAAQSHRRWRLCASDDGSSDATRRIIEAFAAAHPGQVEIREGPRAGFAANYLALAGDPAIRADWYAFADQDDVWLPDRLARGIARLAPFPPGEPALYGGRTLLIDAAGRETGRSPRFRTAPGFGNALVQSIAGGNTMLFNQAAKQLLERARPATVVAHDWWIYMLVSGAGGRVVYDPEPTVRYRQHGANAIGDNQGFAARLRRMRMLAGGKLAEYGDINLAALERAFPLLTPAARAQVERLRRGRRRPFLGRLRAAPRLGLYRQTRGGTLTLWLALLAGRL